MQCELNGFKKAAAIKVTITQRPTLVKLCGLCGGKRKKTLLLS